MVRIRIKMTAWIRRRSEMNFRCKGQIVITPIRNRCNLAWNTAHQHPISEHITPLARSNLGSLSRENRCQLSNRKEACFLIKCKIRIIRAVSLAHQNMETGWIGQNKMTRCWVSRRTPTHNPIVQRNPGTLDVLKDPSRPECQKDQAALDRDFRTKCSRKLENKRRNRSLSRKYSVVRNKSASTRSLALTVSTLCMILMRWNLFKKLACPACPVYICNLNERTRFRPIVIKMRSRSILIMWFHSASKWQCRMSIRT